MKRVCILLLLNFYLVAFSSAQDIASQDSTIVEKQKTDSSQKNNKSFISHQTDALVGSVFGPSKQLGNADSIMRRLDSLPSFGIYKDNYFIIGTELFKKPTKYNSDAKFQISIRNRLTNSTLPFKTYFFLTYTQKAFWDVFQDSFPFRDLNFNPSLGLGRSIVRNNRYLGSVSFQFEHESNGKNGEESRSWNKITFGSYLTLNDRFTFHAKAWIPIVDGENNKDIVHYAGWGFLGLDYSSPRKKYTIGCVLTKRGGPNLNANIELNVSVRLFSDDNQYLFLQYYNGYGESLLDYNRYTQKIRLGIVIKPRFVSIY